jgi:hypothetical protein
MSTHTGTNINLVTMPISLLTKRHPISLSVERIYVGIHIKIFNSVTEA